MLHVCMCGAGKKVNVSRRQMGSARKGKKGERNGPVNVLCKVPNTTPPVVRGILVPPTYAHCSCPACERGE